MHCPAAPRLCKQAPKMPPSVYAIEGTVAAVVAEHCLKQPEKFKPQNYLDKEIQGVEVNEEMVECVTRYVDYILSVFAKVGGELIVEKSFDLSYIHPELGGTTDASIVGNDGGIHVFDLKYGKGKTVQAEDNSQLLVYALGATYKQYYDHLTLYIMQPRQDNWLRPWEVTPAMLKGFEDKVRKAIIKCENPESQPVAGSWCQWCDAAGFCPARRALAYQSAGADFVDPQVTRLPVAETLTDEQLEKVLDSAEMIDSFVHAVRGVALARAEAGAKFDHWKIVKKKSNRRWLDTAEEFIVKKYGDEAYNRKLKSPAQIEKMDKTSKDFLPNLTERPDGGNTLAPVEDKRTALPASASTDFIDI